MNDYSSSDNTAFRIVHIHQFSACDVSPKTPILGEWMAIFKPNSRNEKKSLLYYRMYCIDSNQISHNDKHHQMHFVGGPNMSTTNPRWRTAASRYLCNGLTDFDDILYGDAAPPSAHHQSIKFSGFRNPRWQTATMLNIEKPRHLGNDICLPIVAKFGTIGTLTFALKLQKNKCKN